MQDQPSLRQWALEEVNQSGVVLLDFDGTMTTGGYPEIGDPRESVLEYVRIERSGGRVIVIWTCRTSMYLCKTLIAQTEAVRGIAKWLHENMVEVDGILMHDKPICGLYIGDETMHPDFLEDYEEAVKGCLSTEEDDE